MFLVPCSSCKTKRAPRPLCLASRYHHGCFIPLSELVLTSMNTPNPSPPKNAPPGFTSSTAGGRPALLAGLPWLGYVLPLVVFLLVTSFEPTPHAPPAEGHVVRTDAAGHPSPDCADGIASGSAEPKPATDETSGSAGWFGFAIPYSAYPTVYTLKIASFDRRDCVRLARLSTVPVAAQSLGFRRRRNRRRVMGRHLPIASRAASAAGHRIGELTGLGTAQLPLIRSSSWPRSRRGPGAF